MSLPEKRLGLALGGGAARGFAHVGVLQVLFEAGIQVHTVTGTSVGSLIGAALAAGKTCDEITYFGERVGWLSLTRAVWPRRGFLTFQPLERMLVDWLGDLDIENLVLPFGCVVTDALTGEARFFCEGKLAPRVRASCSVPPIVQPVLIDDCWYVDGGLVDNLPIRFARALGADLVMAVNLFGPATYLPTSFWTYSTNVLGHALLKAGDPPHSADVLVEPELTDFSLLGFKRRELIERGRAAMEHKLPELQALLARDSL